MNDARALHLACREIALRQLRDDPDEDVIGERTFALVQRFRKLAAAQGDTGSTATDTAAQAAHEPERLGISISVADLQLAFRGLKDGDTVSPAQHALVDKFFRQGVPQRDARIAEFVGSAHSVHVPSPFHPIGNIASLSPLCADKAGRVYRYDPETKELILLLSPGRPL